jgi:membrane-associated phospholipid phosphatase
VSSTPLGTRDRKPLVRAVGTLLAVAALLFAFGLLIGLAVVGRHGGGAIQSTDNHAWRWFVEHRYAVGLAKIVATYGDAAALGVICVVISLGLLARRRSPLAFTPIVAFLGGEGQVFLIRQVIHRPRPLTADYPAPGALRGVHETSWSFPSGHATTVTAVLVASLGVLALSRRVIWPWVVAVLASAYVASTRLVLGVHWLSDVSTGLLIGAGWGVAVAVVARGLSAHSVRTDTVSVRTDTVVTGRLTEVPQ